MPDRAALKKSPGQITAMNNLGLSQAQNGQLKAAEGTLRKAYATPAGHAMLASESASAWVRPFSDCRKRTTSRYQ